MHATKKEALAPAVWLRPATVKKLLTDKQIEGRLLPTPEAQSQVIIVRLAQLAGYRAAVGDRLLVLGDHDEAYAVAVLHSATSPALQAADGTLARIGGAGDLTVQDRHDRIIARFVDGHAEICAPERDLKLIAPKGQVLIEAGTDMKLKASRDLSQQAGRRIELQNAGKRQLLLERRSVQLQTERLEVTARESQVATISAKLVARSLSTTAQRACLEVERYELAATKLMEEVTDAYREIRGLAQTRAGRVRMLVREAFSLNAQRNVITSTKDTSIDGERILLG